MSNAAAAGSELSTKSGSKYSNADSMDVNFTVSLFHFTTTWNQHEEQYVLNALTDEGRNPWDVRSDLHTRMLVLS